MGKTAENDRIACNLSEIEAGQRDRHAALLGEIFGADREARELPNGYEFRFPNEPQWYAKIAEWASLERQCCSFITFEQGLDRDGRAWLRLTGDGAAKQLFLRVFSQMHRLAAH